MSTRILVILSLVLCQWFVAVHSSFAQSRAFDFNDGQLPPGSSLFGNAQISLTDGVGGSGVLKLTTNTQSQIGSFIVEDFSGGEIITAMAARFNLRIGGLGCGSEHADGVSFVWANDLPDVAFGEESSGVLRTYTAPSSILPTGLIVSFDTWNNAGVEVAPGVIVLFGGQVLSRTSVALSLLATDDGTTPAFASVSIAVSPGGLLNVVYKDQLVVSNLPLPGFAGLAGGRFGWGARTGGFCDNHFVDDIRLSMNDAQTLPFAQDWSDTGLITINDHWLAPGMIGYRGDGLTPVTGTDPATILADGTGTPVDVLANQTNPDTLTTGGVAEFAITDPTVALQGSVTAAAPFLLLNLNTTGHQDITVDYDLRDLDGSVDDSIQPVALHYRVGNSGDFTNVAAAYVADASSGPVLATLVTPVAVSLPGAVDNQPLVQIRWMTSNAAGSDEWIGIDDIYVSGMAADSDGDGIPDASDNCPHYASTLLQDTDADGRGDVCECTDQNGDGLNTVSDLVEINRAIFLPSLATPLCDGNHDGQCNVSDIVAANIEIFSPTSTSICARQPVPGP